MPLEWRDMPYIRLLGRGTGEVVNDMAGGWVDQLLYYDNTRDEPAITGHGETHSLLSKGQFDAVIDNAYVSQFSDTWPTLAAAITGDADHASGVSIFIRSAGDTLPITIASTDAVQRIQGKDADTTVLPVAMTVNKDDVTIEQLGISSVVLKLGAARRASVVSCLISGAGSLLIGETAGTEADDSLVSDCRFIGTSAAAALTLGENALFHTVYRATVRDSFFHSNTGANDILIDGYMDALSIINCRFNHASASNTGYVVDGSVWLTSYLRMTGCKFTFLAPGGGVNLLTYSSQIVDCLFTNQLTAALTVGKRLLRIASPTNFTINTVVSNCVFNGYVATDVAFECASADAYAKGLRLIGNQFTKCTVLGSQDAVWIGNLFESDVIINFQSKTGIVVIGGDMTGCTLQNIPADIVFWKVKGQADRGVFTGIAEHLLPGADNTYDLGSAAFSWRDLFLDRNALIGGTLGVTGATTLGVLNAGATTTTTLSSTTHLPVADATSNLGSATKQWFDLFIARNALIGGTLDVTGTTTLLVLNAAATTLSGNLLWNPGATYDIGAAGVNRPRDFHLSRNALIGGTLGVTGNTTLTTVDSTTHLPVADNTSDLGSAAKSWRDLFVDRNALIGGTLGVTGTTTLGALVITSIGAHTQTGDLLFTDALYDIGKLAATRPRDLFLSRNATVGGALAVTGNIDGSANLTVATTLTVTGGLVASSAFGGFVSSSVLLIATNPTLGAELFRINTTAANDDPTMSVHQGKVLTTDATVTTAYTHTIPASTTVQLLAFVTARRTGGVLGAAEDGAGYFIQATIKNVAGTATMVGALVPIGTQESQVLWDATIDVTGATARVRVTGATQNNISWGVTVLALPMGT